MTEKSPGYWHTPSTPIHDVFSRKKREEMSILEKQIADLKKQEEQAHLDAIRAIVQEELVRYLSSTTFIAMSLHLARNALKEGDVAYAQTLLDEAIEEVQVHNGKALRTMIAQEVKKALREVKPPQTPHEAWRDWQEMEE